MGGNRTPVLTDFTYPNANIKESDTSQKLSAPIHTLTSVAIVGLTLAVGYFAAWLDSSDRQTKTVEETARRHLSAKGLFKIMTFVLMTFGAPVALDYGKEWVWKQTMSRAFGLG